MATGPLLIGGCPRSGTTAILQVMNSDPRVYISSEENLLKQLQTLEKLLATREQRGKALLKGMRELSARETLTVENIHSHNFSSGAVWPTLYFIYEYHHHEIHSDAQLALWGDKLPGYARELETLLSIPSTRYLHITRNPLDVVNSMMRRLDAARKGKDWWKSITDFDLMIEEWARAYREITAAEHRREVHHMHYEELVFDFESSMAAVNKFLNIELRYQNNLVADPALHYDRSYLSTPMIEKIAAHPAVSDYMSRYGDSQQLKNVSAAARLLRQYA